MCLILQKHVVTAAVAASTVVEQALQAEAQSLQKGLDASILDIRQAAETFDASTALQQVIFLDFFFTTQISFLKPFHAAGGCFLAVFPAFFNANSYYNAGADWH